MFIYYCTGYDDYNNNADKFNDIYLNLENNEKNLLKNSNVFCKVNNWTYIKKSLKVNKSGLI